MAFHLSTKEARGIIVGRAVPYRKTAPASLPSKSERGRLPSGGGALLVASLLALTVKIFVADLAVVDGRSMEPFVSRGSVVLVLRCAYGIRSPGFQGVYWIRWNSPGRGDIVLAFPPASERRVVKRVFPLEPANRGEYFLLGDNPDESRDSREYGPVDFNDIAGKVFRLRS